MMFLKGMEVVSALSFCVSRALVIAPGARLQLSWLFNHEHKRPVPLSSCMCCECTGKDTKSAVVKLEHNCR